MTTARDQAEQAVRALTEEPWIDSYAAAEAASDVWEPIARILRDHQPVVKVNPGGYSYRMLCRTCTEPWFCTEWKRAAEALGR